MHSIHRPKGIPSFPPPSFSFFLSLSPPPLCNSLPSPHVALSSLLLQNWPKVLLLDSKVVRIHGSPPHRPHPHCPGPRQGVGSSLLASAHHDFGDKVDNGRGRLVRVKLSKEVAGVVRGAALLPGHEAEEPTGAGDGKRCERRAGGTPGLGELSR